MSMTDASRDARRARTFPAFPPTKRHGRKMADTWWGNAWVEAVEESGLDPEQMKKGRRHALGGLVGPITCGEGRLVTTVHDGDHEWPFTTVVRLDQLSDAKWDRFLDEVARKSRHLAALLDREMSPDLLRAASDAGVHLLPGYGELDGDCECESWDVPCKHAAAVCYQIGWLLDRDPFVLLLLRGRGEEELRTALHTRTTQGAVSTGIPAETGIPALDAWAAQTTPPADPLVGVQVPELDLAAVLADAEAEPPVDPAGITLIARAAAARARALLDEHPDPLHRLEDVCRLNSETEPGNGTGTDAWSDVWTDALRLAATATDDQLIDRAARASGRPAHFRRCVGALVQAGWDGVVALEETWTPAKDVLVRAKKQWERAWEATGRDEVPAVRVWRNRWTLADHGLQLRLAQDGRWYPFRGAADAWSLAGPPARDLAGVLAVLLDEDPGSAAADS